MKARLIIALLCLCIRAAHGLTPIDGLPIAVPPFEQQVHHSYTTEQGLPDNDVSRLYIDRQGRPCAVTARSTAVFNGRRWLMETPAPPARSPRPSLTPQQLASLQQLVGTEIRIRAVAELSGEWAVAADSGLFLGNGQQWHSALVRQGQVRWAPIDVRAVCYDAAGRLWFAAPQGVGFRLSKEVWKLFTGADGLPFNDFTCMASGPKGLWFGTRNGAVHYQDGAWMFRQGRRWLLDNHVRDLAIDVQGDVWFATAAGVSCIAHQTMTLAKKAAYFEQEIEKYHRRTALGYIDPAELSVPGDKNTAKAVHSDNDGQRMGIYLGAVSLGYAATGRAQLKQQAERAFRSLAFLSEVTQGGSHPAPSGFIARSVIPTTEPDPNLKYDLSYDLRRQKRDPRWKIMQPRWPVDKSGKWYWLCDGSADELDGHYFGYALYFDHVCKTEADRAPVRTVVRRITDHLIDHSYHLVDYDGQPTRWGYLSPDALNRDEAWVIERGLRSFAALSYLSVAHHITGDSKYRQAYLELAWKHGYAMNGMTQPRDLAGPGTFGQGDDKMAFMNYYHLVRYETDEKLLSMFYHAIHRHWLMEQYERSPWANFIYAACCLGKVRRDHWGERDLTPPASSFTDAISTLQSYPLDLIDWPMSNRHRIDLIPLPDILGERSGPAGYRIDGYVFPIDERTELRWGEDPYLLAGGGQGARLEKGVHYLLAYYMGCAHGFIKSEE
ncbi:MAG: Two component regulator propeller [bacterium ADurb.Bin478]|nr:MAG: Two component regulator propeller [bacterium ADurb.Bin478]